MTNLLCWRLATNRLNG